MVNIIVVDDDRALRKNLAFYLRSQSYEVDTANSGEEAIELINNKFYDILVSDIKMKKMSGFELMKTTRNIHPATEIILVTGYGNIPMAVDAIQKGAADFICKPFEFGNLLTRIEKIIHQREQKVTSTDKYNKLITKSQKMQDVLDLTAKASQNELATLIEGEPGVGKELMARAIHERSSRKDFPFKVIECSSMDENNLQIELFGNWNNNDNEYSGMIIQANGGTLFIKDVEQLSGNLQTRLLRYIQDGFYTDTINNQKIKSDVRIICSSTNNLKKLVSSGQFREDLFYAINIMPIYIPPLRNRIADIFPLVNHFLEKYSAKFDKDIKAISSDILAWMQTYKWPGNIAELENSIARACALSNAEIIDESLIFTLSCDRPISEEEHGFLSVTLKDSQKALILKALKQNTGNYTRTAQQLGISRTTLWRRMKKFKIEENLIK